MAEEEKIEQTEEKVPTTEEKKANAVQKIVEFITNIMKIVFSKGNADTVWYKKGIYYTLAIFLAGLVYAFTVYGVEILDWGAELIKSLF